MECWLEKYERLNELRRRIVNHCQANQKNVFDGYIEWGERESLIQNDAERIENILAQLDSVAWEELIKKVLPFSCDKDKIYGWRQFYNHLNEARGYVLLKNRGYSQISFVQTSSSRHGPVSKCADLVGLSPTSRAILDVKTINVSDDEIERNLKRNDPTLMTAQRMGERKRPGDIINPMALAEKLVKKQEPVSIFLWSQLDDNTQSLLEKPGTDTQQVETLLVENLNQIIKGPCIYDATLFQSIRYRLQYITTCLLEDQAHFPDSSCLNRCLLDDVYPKEIRKWSSVLSVVDLGNEFPIPTTLLNKLKMTVESARVQIESSIKLLPAKTEAQADEKVVLLIINRDFGCSPITLKRLHAELQQPDLEAVCEIGDF